MTDHKQQLLDRIEDRSARVAVIGLGYVGLPLAVGFAQAGFRTTSIDVDRGKVAAVNAGDSYIGDVAAADVAAQVAAGRLSATADFDVLSDCDAVSICVLTRHPRPTTQTLAEMPNLTYSY